MDCKPSFVITELLAQTGFSLHSGDHSSTMDWALHEINKPMDWQPLPPADTGLMITPHLTSPTFHSFNVTMTARLSAAFIILSFPPPQPLNQEATNLLYPELVFFMDSIICCADLPNSMLFGMLCLLHHLRGMHPAGWSNCELFFITFIITSKILCTQRNQ